jgi:hypothetical protein
MQNQDNLRQHCQNLATVALVALAALDLRTSLPRKAFAEHSHHEKLDFQQTLP